MGWPMSSSSTDCEPSIIRFIQLIGADKSGTTPDAVRVHVDRIQEEIDNLKARRFPHTTDHAHIQAATYPQ